MPQYQLGEWLPDQPQIALPGLIEAKNVLPTATGYTSFSSPINLAGVSALSNKCVGADSGTTQGGNIYTIAGSQSEIKVIWNSGDFADATPSGGITGFGSASSQWEFEQYGDRLIALAPGVEPLSVDTESTGPGTSNRFSAVSPNASKATTCTVHKDFLILGNVEGRGNNASAIGTQKAGLHWSAIGDPTNWPTVATQSAIDVQSDFQVLDGSGGDITAIISAGDYVAVLRERQVWRMDYVGGSAFFAFRKIDHSRGCMLPRTAVAVNGVVYFPSVEGFMAFDGARLYSIGEEKIDRTWRATMDFDNTLHCCAAHNAETHSIYWTISSGSGLPSKIFGYRYDMERWFEVDDRETQWVLNTFALNMGGNLDATIANGGLSDQNMDNYTENLDALGADDSTSAMAIFDSSNKLAAYTDSAEPLGGTIVTGDFESPPPTRSVLGYIRPIYEGEGSVSGTAAGRVKPVDTVVYKPLTHVESTGVLAGVLTNRVGGRYLRAKFTTSGGSIENFSGFDAELRQVGTR